MPQPIAIRDKEIRPGQVFVFGSNRAGIHGAGAALFAHRFHGAALGVGEGLILSRAEPWGGSYAIPTKDENIETLPLSEIKEHVEVFCRLAEVRSDLSFFVTRIGCGLAGYNDRQIAPLFRNAPTNCELPTGWRELIQEEILRASAQARQEADDREIIKKNEEQRKPLKALMERVGEAVLKEIGPVSRLGPYQLEVTLPDSGDRYLITVKRSS